MQQYSNIHTPLLLSVPSFHSWKRAENSSELVCNQMSVCSGAAVNDRCLKRGLIMWK